MSAKLQSHYHAIYAIVRQIPYGKVSTYGEIAKRAGLPKCIDPSDHKLYKFGKLYRARQVLRSLMTDRNTIDEHS